MSQMHHCWSLSHKHSKCTSVSWTKPDSLGVRALQGETDSDALIEGFSFEVTVTFRSAPRPAYCQVILLPTRPPEPRSASSSNCHLYGGPDPLIDWGWHLTSNAPTLMTHSSNWYLPMWTVLQGHCDKNKKNAWPHHIMIALHTRGFMLPCWTGCLVLCLF